MLLIIPTVYLANQIDIYNFDFAFDKGIYGEDILFKVLGSTRKILSNQFLIVADSYHHGGVQHLEDRQHTTYLGSEGIQYIGAKKWNILPFIAESINIHTPKHLHGEQEKEKLPWFYYAVKMDPNNVYAYELGGYCIGERSNEPDEGIKFLEEGLKHNPDSWEIYMQIGIIYLIKKHDSKTALENFTKAYELLPENFSDKYCERRLYTFMAECYKNLGDLDKAIYFNRKIQDLFPDSEIINNKIERLIEEHNAPCPHQAHQHNH